MTDQPARVFATPFSPLPGVQPEAVFLGYADTEGLVQAREEALADAAAQEAAALSEANEDETPGDSIATQLLADDELDAMIETLTADQFRRTAIVIFASDISAIIEKTNEIPANLDDMLTIARYIETGEIQ